MPTLPSRVITIDQVLAAFGVAYDWHSRWSSTQMRSYELGAMAVCVQLVHATDPGIGSMLNRVYERVVTRGAVAIS